MMEHQMEHPIPRRQTVKHASYTHHQVASLVRRLELTQLVLGEGEEVVGVGDGAGVLEGEEENGFKDKM